MPNRYWIQVLPLAILFALPATTSHTQEAIGKATSVRPQAEGSHGGTRTAFRRCRRLFEGDSPYR
jgi:hypothetical protein